MKLINTFLARVTTVAVDRPDVPAPAAPGNMECPGDLDPQRLRATLRDAARLQVLRRMQGTVYHDFASPMQAATLTFDLLRRQLQRPQTDEERERIMLLLEGGKAELARLRHGVAHVMEAIAESEDRRPVDLGPLVERLGAGMQNESAFLGLQLEIAHPEPGLTVDGAPEEVRQLLTILMLYAIDGLSPGGKLRVELRKDDGGWAQLKLFVDGVKEPRHWSARMFHLDWTAPNTLTSIGPYVARDSAAQLGGALDVETTAEKSATLRLRLPIAR
jgi:signal transduction histidine kinase